MSKYYHEYILPAMDMLVGDPDILTPTADTKKKAEYLCIPYQYINRLGTWRYEMSSRGESAKQLLKSFGNILVYLNEHPERDYFTCENGMKVLFCETGINDDSSTINCIYLAKKFQQEHMADGSVAIMTGSDWMIARAAAAHIDIARINPEIYTGRKKIKFPDQESAMLWEKRRYISQAEWAQIFRNEPLHMNEFIEFPKTSDDFSNIGRFTYDKHGNPAVIPLKYLKFSSHVYRNIRPLTAVQAMYMEALLAPVDEIPIVVFSGLFGTGKTFMPIAVGLNGVSFRTEQPNLKFQRIFICPRDSALGKDIGFLPGNVTDKVMAKALPVIDNIRDIIEILSKTSAEDSEAERTRQLANDAALNDFDDLGLPPAAIKKREKRRQKNAENEAKKRTAENIDREVANLISQHFEFQPLINMGGRSITRSLIFYDEFQDVERFQARELVSRIGNGSKMVIAGDPTQLSNPHLNRTSNGLNYIATKLADKPYAAVITSNNEDEIIRHWVLREVAKALSR